MDDEIITVHPIDEAVLNLPEEIIVEILARLPVKSLLKFRCVSKSWLSIISSSQFVKAHLTVTTNKEAFSNSRVLINIWLPELELKQSSLHSLIFEPLTVASAIDYPLKYPHKVDWVVGTCNGLICLAIDTVGICLWNPSTRVSKTLPSVAVNFKQGYPDLWGFGYDEKGDDYKIVCIFEHDFGNGVAPEVIVKIYSLKTNSWKRINDFNGRLPFDTSSNFANGKLHFLATPGNDLVSLDLNSEEYGIIEQPTYGDGSFETVLGVLDGCIGVLCRYPTIRAHVWVLKEYGVKDSWTKVATFRDIYEPAKCIYSFPLCMLPNGDIVFPHQTHFKIYNPKEKCFRTPGTSNLNRILFIEAFIYVESLVSL